MAATLYKAATSNAFNTTLNGSINDSDTTITLTTTSGLQAPGVVVIDRVDANDVQTPNVKEYISFTGISSNDLTGCTRGLGGSSAQAHTSGAVVEEAFSITHWNSLIDFLEVSHDEDGNIVVTSTVTLENLRLLGHLSASGASITGQFPIHPTWEFNTVASMTSAGVGVPAAMPQAGNWEFFSVVLNGPASGATMIFDIDKNGTSIFDETNRPMIPAGGTYVSTASIGTLAFNAGDVLRVNVDASGDIVADAIATVVTGRAG